MDSHTSRSGGDSHLSQSLRSTISSLPQSTTNIGIAKPAAQISPTNKTPSAQASLVSKPDLDLRKQADGKPLANSPQDAADVDDSLAQLNKGMQQMSVNQQGSGNGVGSAAPYAQQQQQHGAHMPIQPSNNDSNSAYSTQNLQLQRLSQSAQPVEGVSTFAPQQQQMAHYGQTSLQHQPVHQPHPHHQGIDQVFKLFVGQIPPFTSEETVRGVFSQFGHITHVVILKDRFTGAHKGCGFVCYGSQGEADAAIAALADKVRLPNAKREMIVRYAGERPQETEYKLYVCMLSRSSQDSDVRRLFAPYGALTEVFVIRSRDGQLSKGSAFVKFAQRASADAAIAALHERVRDNDAPQPLQVRYAHTKDERMQHLSHVLGATQPVQLNSPSPNQFLNGGNPRGPMPNSGVSVPSANSTFYTQNYSLQQQQQLNGPPASQSLYNSSPYGSSQGHQNSGYIQQQPLQRSQFNPSGVGQGSAGFGQQAAATYSRPGPGGAPIETQFVAMPLGGPPAASQGNPSLGIGAPQTLYYSADPPPNAANANSSSPYQNSHRPGGDNRVHNPNSLFVYNLPDSYGESELATLFTNFGNVVSTRIQRDPHSGHSKGYGFVSYDTPAAASLAIESLDGFTIGNKKLTVRIKLPHGSHQQQQQQQQQSLAHSAAGPAPVAAYSIPQSRSGGIGQNFYAPHQQSQLQGPGNHQLLAQHQMRNSAGGQGFQGGGVGSALYSYPNASNLAQSTTGENAGQGSGGQA